MPKEMIEQQKTLAEKFIKKGFWLYFFTYLLAPTGYIVKMLISRDISVNDVGIIYGVMTLMILVSSLNDFGMAESLNKFIPQFITEKRYDKVKTIMVYSFLTQVITGALIFSLFYFGANFLGTYYFKDVNSIEVIKIFAFYFLGMTFFHVLNIFFQAVQDTFAQKLTEFLRMLFTLIYVVYLYFSKNGDIISYSYSWVLSLYFGVFVSLALFYKKYFKEYLKEVKYLKSAKLFKKIFKYALIVFLGAQASTILSQVDMLMIIYLLGNEDAGYYTVYLNLINIPFLLLGPILAFLFPIFSEMVAKNEHEKITQVKQLFTKNFLSFAIFFTIYIFVFAINIATVLFGPNYEMSGEILKYSVLLLNFNFLFQVNLNIMAANGKIKQRLYIILIALFVNTIMNFVLIKAIGVVGAALATGIGWILIYVLSELQTKEYFKHLDYIHLIKNIGIFGMLGVFMYLNLPELVDDFSKGIFIRGFFILALIGLTYFAIYVLVNLKDFKYFLGEIKKLKK